MFREKLNKIEKMRTNKMKDEWLTYSTTVQASTSIMARPTSLKVVSHLAPVHRGSREGIMQGSSGSKMPESAV